MIDSHSHLDYFDDTTLFDILERAKANNVTKMVIPAVEPDGFERILGLCDKYENLFCALGVQPEETNKYNSDVIKTIDKLSKNEKVVAIGEIGLDYHWTTDTKEPQKLMFKEQVELAKKLSLPLIVHDRDAHADTFDILKAANLGDLKVVMHCFSGSVEFMKQCVKEGFYIALGGVVTFKNAIKPKEVAKEVPLDRLLLETDCPYLAPVPFRGKDNEPSFIKYTLEEIAKLRSISPCELDEITTKNAELVFKI